MYSRAPVTKTTHSRSKKPVAKASSQRIRRKISHHGGIRSVRERKAERAEAFKSTRHAIEGPKRYTPASLRDDQHSQDHHQKGRTARSTWKCPYRTVIDSTACLRLVLPSPVTRSRNPAKSTCTPYPQHEGHAKRHLGQCSEHPA